MLERGHPILGNHMGPTQKVTDYLVSWRQGVAGEVWVPAFEGVVQC